VTIDVRDWALANLTRPKSSGKVELVAQCPWCRKEGKFYLNTATGAYICFSCESKGKTIAGLLAEVEGISVSQARARLLRTEIDFPRRRDSLSLRERLAELRGLDLDDEPDELVDIPLPEEFVPVWNGRRWSFPTYLKERGLTRRTAHRFGLGYCTRGRYADRVVCPIVCPGGRSFTARAITGDARVKYLNPRGAGGGRLVYGWEQAAIGADVAIVEGPFDVLNCAQKGLNAIGLLGKALHPNQLSIFGAWPKGAAATVLLDPEAEAEAWGIASRLHGVFDAVFVGRLPAGRDPGDASRTELEEAVEGAEMFTGSRVRGLRARLNSIKMHTKPGD
jgi:DNA primase